MVDYLWEFVYSLLISWSYWSWAVVSVGSVYVFGFWFLLGLSLMGLSHQLVIWGSVCPPPLVFCCAGVGRLRWSWFFHVYKVLRLFSCSCSVVCSHYVVVSPDRSWVEFVWLPLPPSPSSVVICCWYLCWWVSSSRRNPHQQRNHQQKTTEGGEGGCGSHTNSTQDLSGDTTK